ncbi:exopolysaccharide biosynthesis protein [Cereibacter sphaeroides]|nr:exopolysaccharide biosynthesis protein [Cereibacter sphaeroides]
MTQREQTRLTDLLDDLSASIDEDQVSIRHIVETLGEQSSLALMFLFALISTSPASAIPGVTTMVAVIVGLLALQLIAGRRHLWLPDLIMRRKLEAKTLRKGVRWLRRPIAFTDRLLRPRLTFLSKRPWTWLPLSLIVLLTLFMPIMEFVPTSGSIASAAIALCVAGLLTRDGALVLLSVIPLAAVPVTLYAVGFGA